LKEPTNKIIKDNKKMNMLKIIPIIALISSVLFVALQISGEKVDAWLPACWCIIYLIESK